MIVGNPKVERLIQQTIADVFLYDLRDDLANLMVSVTRVTVTPRLEKAVVYVSAALLENADRLVAILNQHRGRIRYLVGNRIRNKVRHIPELHFVFDDTILFQERLDKLIGKPSKHQFPEHHSDEADS